MRVFYRVNGCEFDLEITFSPPWMAPKDIRTDRRELRRIATECARDFHFDHDGWESSWPLELEILDGSQGETVGRFEIERELVPEFNASEIEEDAKR